jgi:3-oxoacyl-(acyl-carrier-protein) synthase
LAGVLGGLRTGTRVGMWTLTFVGIEYGVVKGLQKYSSQGTSGVYANKHSARWIASGVAGLSIAGGASLFCKCGDAWLQHFGKRAC